MQIDTKKELYGGAMTCNIPSSFVDCSMFRQIPDHQEVFVDTSTTDQSLIFEILEYDKNISDDSIAEYHFNELASVNESTKTKIIHKENIKLDKIFQNHGSVVQYLVGEQSVSKFNEKSENIIQLYLAVIRVKEKNSEILITLNNPIVLDQNSSSAKVSTNSNPNENQDFKNILFSFKILDLNVFGN